MRAKLFRFVVGKIDFSGHFSFNLFSFVYIFVFVTKFCKVLDIQLLNITKVFIEIIEGVYGYMVNEEVIQY